MRKLLLVGMMLLTSITTFAQISGKVFDSETDDDHTSFIIIEGTSDGTVSGLMSTFTLDVGRRRTYLLFLI